MKIKSFCGWINGNASIKHLKTFGFKVIYYKLILKIWANGKNFEKINNKYHKTITNYLIRKYEKIICKWSNAKEPKYNDDVKYIWVMWLQGYDDAPIIVRQCIESIKQHAGDAKVILLDNSNYKKYVEFPEYIIKKTNEGMIDRTKFSNLLRLKLLYNYGGLWIDATVYVTKMIDENIFCQKFFTLKRREYIPNISNARWTTYLMAGKRKNPLFGYLLEMHEEYWKENELNVDYFLFDYFIAIGYEEILWMRKMIDKVPYSNPEIHKLRLLLNEDFDKKEYESIIKNTFFHKLSWKISTSESRRFTYYQYILKVNLHVQ